ncbi:MAG: DUF4126 family protein [Chthoniobacterales bacterium]
MNTTVVIAAVFIIGFFSGLRSFAPLALISWMAIWGWTPVAGSPFWFVGTEVFAIVISVLAVLELIADKLPKTPARIQVMPLIARLVTGSIAGGALSISAGQSWPVACALAALGSVTGAFSGYYSRKAVVRTLHVPDFFVALVEDLITIGGTLVLVHNFFHTPV